MDSSLLIGDHDFDEPGTTLSVQNIAGYLDNVLTIFNHHNHPFILVGAFAMQWSGSNPLPDRAIDILVSSAQAQAIVDDLVASREWTLSSHASSKRPYDTDTYQNSSPVPDFWLVSTKPDFSGILGCQYLRLWPEDLYKIRISACVKVEVPDLFPRQCLLIEEDYYRDPCNT